MTGIIIILLLIGVVLTCTIVVARRSGHEETEPTYLDAPAFSGSILGRAIATDLSSPAVPPEGARIRAVGMVSEVDEQTQIMDDVIKGLQQIPPLPTVLIQVLSELDNRSGSATSLANVISSEPVLTASLLRAANSAATGLVRRIMSVDEAVAYLGHSTIRGLVLRMQMAKLLPSGRKDGYDSDQLWKHSLAVGQVAAHLARRVVDVEPGLVSTIGVLHDIGKLALNSLFPTKVAQLFASGGGSAGESFLARERCLFGGDHAFVGSILASQWKLPHGLVDAIRCHHFPLDASLTSMTAELRRAMRIVHVANQLVKYSHVYCANMEIDLISEQLLIDLGLPPRLENLLDSGLQTVIQRSMAMCGAVDTSAQS